MKKVALRFANSAPADVGIESGEPPRGGAIGREDSVEPEGGLAVPQYLTVGAA